MVGAFAEIGAFGGVLPPNGTEANWVTQPVMRTDTRHERREKHAQRRCAVLPSCIYGAPPAQVRLTCYEGCDNSPGSNRGLLGRNQGLLPQSQQCSSEPQDVPSGVAITVEDQPTAGVEAISEGQCLPMSTARAVLRRLRGVHREKAPTGPGCLVGDVRCERGPRRSMDALGETGGMPHPVYRQVVDGNHRKGVDEPAAVLVCEVPPAPGEALVDTGP